MALQNAGGVVASLGGDFALLAAMQGKLQDAGMGDAVDDAASSVMALFKQGIGSVEEFADVLRNSGGAAAEMATRQLDNLAGDVEQLGGAWETSPAATVAMSMIWPMRKAVRRLTASWRT